MGMTINTNMSALTAYRNLSTTQNEMSKSLEKLSSGLRINRAADDAAGLAISEGLKSQVGGLTVAARNAQDGINVAQTAEGSLGQVQAILQRMRDLAVQAGNDSNNGASRTAITNEAGQLKDELGRISTSTNFNGISLLDGTAGTAGVLTFQVGANKGSDNQIKLDLSTADVSSIVTNLDFSATSFQNTTAAVGGATGVDLSKGFQITQGGTVVTVASAVSAGANISAVVSNLNGDAGFSQNFTASADKDGALVVTSKTSAAGAITINQDKTAAATYTDAVTVAAGTPGTAGFGNAADAQNAIKLIDDQIKVVSGARASLGAVQNRLEYSITNLNISKENLTASQSQITDTDMASEMVNFTRSSILSQAGTAMLAQANQSNSGVLKLLQ